MSNSEVICLSSDEEEKSPPRKRIKPTPASTTVVDTIETPKETIVTENNNTVKEEQPGCSKNEIVELTEQMKQFLQVCAESVQDSNLKQLTDKFSVINKFYKRCSNEFITSEDFKSFVESKTENARKSPSCAVVAFQELLNYLRQASKGNNGCIELKNKKSYLAIQKLESTIKEVVAKISELEDQEINFEDEENSAYMQIDRYKRRLDKLYKFYCKLIKANPYSSSITHQKIVFQHSKYDVINKAISKNYKDNFPDYDEIDELVRKTLEEHNIVLTDKEIEEESRKCFKKLGKMLQSRRKTELLEVHTMIVEDFEDPASKDGELNSKLNSNSRDAEQRIDDICEEFVRKQEKKEEPETSSDESETDKSNEEDDEDEDGN